GIGAAMFKMSLWLVALIPYLICLAWLWRTHVHERRDRLQALLPITRAHVARADALVLLLPCVLASLMALVVVLSSVSGIERHGMYSAGGVWVGWVGECMLLSALLLFFSQRMGRDRALSLIVLLGALQLGIHPAMVVGANLVGEAPYVLPRLLNQITMSYWGGAGDLAVSGLLLWSYLRRASRTEAAR
ncbi:MAG: hypothetical protein HOC05_05370, partial [Gemmatimonadetes bacterium]|nr:hypothetical protein [Gemmatimonadota bacterium]